MERLHDFDVVRWDHEPTPNPSQEGNSYGEDERLLPSGEGSGVVRLIESRQGRASGGGKETSSWPLVPSQTRKTLS